MADTLDRLTSALADRYRIERELGAGGMATVYLAEDLKHKRQVAIKVLRPELAQAVGAERFLQEIETTANLRHPHILPLYDSGNVGGFLFYVMPLVEGESLRDRLDRDKQLPLDDALRIAREVADALGYAHARGVVHRDIKPENIMLDGGHAVVADFGIARAMSAAGADRLTQTGTSIGTPLYMSPEQAAGDPDVDGRSDLYSLGCVLYEMLGGQPPFTGPTAEAITRQHMITEAAPVTNLRPTVPAAVAGALARTLAKNPADRFSPASQFVQALSASDRSATPSGRSRLRPALIAVGVVSVAAAGWFGSAALRSDGAASTINRIAVLPMDNQTGDSSQAFFADGMTRELIGVLTEAGVRVMGHRAVVPYAGSTLPISQIARELNVDALVTAAVLASGDVVQVAVELTDPKTGESLWARTFSRPASEVVTLQREVAGEIARGIQARLTPEQERVLATRATVNPRAYAQYLLGQEQANLRTPDGYFRSVEHLDRSIALDSTFAPAWAAVAMTNAYGLLYQTAPTEVARAAVERAAARAIQLDDHLGDPHFAIGLARLHTDWDFPGAEEEFARGWARPHSAMARALFAWTSWEMGEFDKSVAASLANIEVEPTTGQWHSDLAWGYWSGGDGAKARAAALRAIELDSTFYEPNDVLSYAYADAGEHELAERAHQRAKAVAGGAFWFDPIARGIVSRARGDTATIRRALIQLGADDPRYGQKAFLHFALGEREQMYRMFNRALDTRDADVLWILNAVPALYPIRGEPAYQQVLARLGLPEALRK
ncbi:MAG: serine/threonine-protein kinase [Gemmatimonadota bacterium]|nr:serine/threonine-protein kinase [Gemmatimonadota bacterium]